MAGNGPAPKPDGQRRRRNAPTHGAERVLLDDGTVRGPDIYDLLPSTVFDDVAPEVVESVVSWWGTWRRSPMAQAFIGTDWQRLAMLAPLVAAYWSLPSTSILAEIRLNEERLGATVTDRLKARVRVQPAENATVLSLAPKSAADRLAALGGTE